MSNAIRAKTAEGIEIEFVFTPTPLGQNISVQILNTFTRLPDGRLAFYPLKQTGDEIAQEIKLDMHGNWLMSTK